MQVYTAILVPVTMQSSRAFCNVSRWGQHCISHGLRRKTWKHQWNCLHNNESDGQVARYLRHEKAFLAGELDPAFKDFNAWECRFATNDPYTNEELAWGRQMLRNFRPDHITNANHSWRYGGSSRVTCHTAAPPMMSHWERHNNRHWLWGVFVGVARFLEDSSPAHSASRQDGQHRPGTLP